MVKIVLKGWNNENVCTILYCTMKRITDIEKIKKFFSGDSYFSPGYDSNENNLPIVRKGKLSFFKTFAFYMRFINILRITRSLACKGKCSRDEFIKSCFYVIQSIEKSGGVFAVTGLNNLRKTESSLVIVANHMSTLETIVFPCIIGIIKDATYVVKKSLITNPIFGPIMQSLDPVDVERKEPRKDLDAVLSKGTALLAAGRSIILFPQATRTAFFEPDKFNSLGVKLAKRSNTQIIPLALKTDFWSSGKIVSTFGHLYPDKTIHMKFGEAITIDGAGKREQEKIIEFIGSTIEKWQILNGGKK